LLISVHRIACTAHSDEPRDRRLSKLINVGTCFVWFSPPGNPKDSRVLFCLHQSRLAGGIMLSVLHARPSVRPSVRLIDRSSVTKIVNNII